MPRHTSLRTLCALPLLIPGALAHMQMQEPSPLRDPHSNRTAEPKDYNILTPLHPDGSDFACKGYQWNTPLTTVAQYQAGKTYPLRLMGGATHGGGSCQISLSCDYTHFNVIKSMEGNCPIEKEYEFTIPNDVPTAEKCLLAWTWFNKIGNREMYMNCAVVDLIGASSSSSPRQRTSTKASSAAVAQAALSLYPDLYVANLKSVNDCATKETVDVVFDNPGSDVVYGDGLSASSSRIMRRKGSCSGVGRTAAGSSSSDSSSSGASAGSAGSSDSGSTSFSSGSSAGQDGMWHPDQKNAGSGSSSSGSSGSSSSGSSGSSSSSGNSGSSASSGGSTGGDDGMWHPEKYGGAASSGNSGSSSSSSGSMGGNDGQWHPDVGSSSGGSAQSHPMAMNSGSSSGGSSSNAGKSSSGKSNPSSASHKAPMTNVEKELAAYLESIGEGDHTYSVSHSERENVPSPKKGKHSPRVGTQRTSAGEFSKYRPDQGSDPNFRTQQIHSREPPDDEEPTGAPNAPDYDFINHQAKASSDDSDSDDDSRHSSRPKDHTKTPSFEVEESSSDAANRENYGEYDDIDALPDFLKDFIGDFDDDDHTSDDEYASDDESDGFSGIYDRQKVEKKKHSSFSKSKKAKHSKTKTSENTESTAAPESEASTSEDAATPTADFDSSSVEGAAATPTKLISLFDLIGKDDAAVPANVSFSAPSFLNATASPTASGTELPTELLALFPTDSISSTTESANTPTEAIISLDEPSVAVPFTPVEPLPTEAVPLPAAPSVAAPGGACTPGSFFCNGEKQFWVCGQFGGDAWTYGALRDVSEGMACSDGKINRRSLDRRSVSKRGFGWYIGQDDSSWRSDVEDESPLDPIINAIDTLIKAVPKLATNKKRKQGDYVPGYKNTDDWYQPYKLLKRKLGWWISSSNPSNEVPSNPLVTITDKLKKLESALDWTIEDLTASKNKDNSKSQKRSSGWWLSFGGDDGDNDKGYSSTDKDKNKSDRDPLDDILWQVDDLSDRFDKLKSLSGWDSKWKRGWGFFGQYGKDDMNKEVAKGQLGDPFEPILSKLKSYIRLVRGLLPGEKGKPHGNGYVHQRPKFPWDKKGWAAKRQVEAGEAGEGVSDPGDFGDFLGDGVFEDVSGQDNEDEDDDDEDEDEDEDDERSTAPPRGSEDGPPGSRNGERRPKRPSPPKRPNRPGNDFATIPEDFDDEETGKKSSPKAGNNASASSRPSQDDEDEDDSTAEFSEDEDSERSVPADDDEDDEEEESDEPVQPAFDPNISKVPNPFAPGGPFARPGDAPDGSPPEDSDSDSDSSDFVTLAEDDDDASDDFDFDFDFDDFSAKKRKLSKRQDYGDDVQVPGFQYSEGGDGGNGIDGVEDAAQALFGKQEDDVTSELDPNAEDEPEEPAPKPSGKTPSKAPAKPAATETKDATKGTSDDSEDDVEDSGDEEDEDEGAGDDDADEEEDTNDDNADEEEEDEEDDNSSDNSTARRLKRDDPVILPAGFNFSDGTNGGDGVDEDPVALFGDEPSDYEKEWGVAPEAEKQPQPSITSLAKRDDPVPTGFIFSDGSNGGDGVDEDPLALFGTEPSDYESKWGVSDEAEKQSSTAPLTRRDDPVPAGFTFSDGSKGGDGVGEDATTLFGAEPSDYQAKWGVSDKFETQAQEQQPQPQRELFPTPRLPEVPLADHFPLPDLLSDEKSPLPLPAPMKKLNVLSPGGLKHLTHPSRLEFNSPERYDWGEKRKRQAAPVPATAPKPAAGQAAAQAPAASPAPQQVVPHEIVPLIPNTQAPADFTFSDGKNGGDGVDDDVTAIFGDEPSEYEQKWGVDDKAAQNETVQIVDDVHSTKTAPAAAAKQTVSSEPVAGRQGVPIPMGKAQAFDIRPRPAALSEVTLPPSAVLPGVDGVIKMTPSRLPGHKVKPTTIGFGSPEPSSPGARPAVKPSTAPVDIHDNPDAPVFLPEEVGDSNTPDDLPEGPLPTPPSKGKKAKSRPSEIDASTPGTGPSDTLEEPASTPVRGKIHPTPDIALVDPIPSFSPSVKAKAKPAPGFFDSIEGNFDTLEDANAVPETPPEAEAITGPIGKLRPHGNATPSALPKPSGLDVTADPSILDKDGGPDGFLPQPNQPGVRPSVSIPRINATEVVSEEHVPDISVAGAAPSLASLGPDGSEDEAIRFDSEDEEDDAEGAEDEGEEDEDSELTSTDNEEDDEDEDEDEDSDDSELEEDENEDEKPILAQPLVFIASPVSAPLLNSTSTPTSANTTSPSSIPTTTPSTPWRDGIFPHHLPLPADAASTPSSDFESILPLIMGPGPVVPPGVTLRWPGPWNLHHFPPSPSSFPSSVEMQTVSASVPSTMVSVTVPGLPGVTGSWPPAVPGATGAPLVKARVKRWT
ncbi:hypothetical protein PMIN07_000898 [Paraphaeosphaeria minitans]